MAIFGAWFVKDITDLKMAGIVAAIIIVGIVCRTWTDVKGKKVNEPAAEPEGAVKEDE